MFGYSILGHFTAQSPHPRHLSSSTYRGFFLIVILKFPAFPFILVIFDKVNNSMFGFW